MAAARGVAIYTHIHRLRDGKVCWLVLVDESLDNTAAGTDLHSNARWWVAASRRVEWGEWAEARLADRLGQALRGRDADLSVHPSLAGYATASLLLAPAMRWDGRQAFPVADVIRCLLSRTRLPVAISRDIQVHLAALTATVPGRLEWSIADLSVKVVFRPRGSSLAVGRPRAVVSRYRAAHLNDTQDINDVATPVLACSSEGQLAQASDDLLQWALDHSLSSKDVWERLVRDRVGRDGVIDLRLRWFIPVTHDRLVALDLSTSDSDRAARSLGISIRDIPLESISEGSLVARPVPSSDETALLFLSHVLDHTDDVVMWFAGVFTAPVVHAEALVAALEAKFTAARGHDLGLDLILRLATDRLMVKHGLTHDSLPLDAEVTGSDIRRVLESTEWFACPACFRDAV